MLGAELVVKNQELKQQKYPLRINDQAYGMDTQRNTIQLQKVGKLGYPLQDVHSVRTAYQVIESHPVTNSVLCLEEGPRTVKLRDNS